MRYELKMTFDVMQTQQILNKLFSSSLSFKEIFYERQVNNIYFDTLDYDDLKANIDGLFHRSKFRIRWYGCEETFYPILEEKIKQGQLGYKKNTELQEKLSVTGILDNYKSIKLDDLNETLRFNERHPVLYNSYSRRYFMSANSKIRVTLDKNIEYAHVKKHRFPIKQNKLAILELKFEQEDYNEVQQLIQNLGFRFDKNSKYVEGISLINAV